MPEEAERAPEEVQETPQTEPETPAQDTAEGSEEAVNWQQRYEEARPELDRVRQLNSQYENVIAAAQNGDQEALELLGLTDPEEEEEWDPEEEAPHDPRVDALLQEREQEQELRQQQEFQEAQFEHMDDEFDALQKTAGREFSEEEIQTIADLAQANLDDEGMPRVKDAYERLNQILTAQKKAYASGKRKATLPPEGIPGSEKVNLKDDQSRQAAMARVMEAEADSG